MPRSRPDAWRRDGPARTRSGSRRNEEPRVATMLHENVFPRVRAAVVAAAILALGVLAGCGGTATIALPDLQLQETEYQLGNERKSTRQTTSHYTASRIHHHSLKYTTT